MSVTEKSKENEHGEAQSEGNGLLPVDCAPVELENQDMADVEEMEIRSSDEVCAVWQVLLPKLSLKVLLEHLLYPGHSLLK